MKKIDYSVRLLLIFSIIFVFYLTVRALYFGAFAFWFDPARDLALGLANLKKISLIGHPSGGLPGLFYGPYYIWFISFAELFNKDPRWIWFFFAAVPYFTLFPLGLFLSAEEVAYVILPTSKDKGALQSFTDYHTPKEEFETKKRWLMDDGTIILRRERIMKK